MGRGMPRPYNNCDSIAKVSSSAKEEKQSIAEAASTAEEERHPQAALASSAKSPLFLHTLLRRKTLPPLIYPAYV